MMNVKSFVSKYAQTNSGEMQANRRKINSTLKWVEYSLDHFIMSKLLIQTKDLREKYALMNALDIAERKKLWHFRQENFNLSRASELLRELIKVHG